jgi:hypothetical protein
MKKDILSFRDFAQPNSLPDFIYESEEEHEEISGPEDDDEDEEEEGKYLSHDGLNLTQERLNLLREEFELSDDEINSLSNKETDNSEFYKLWRDVNEKFECDIFIEGAKPENTQARLVIESEEWNLIFNGTIQNGKCQIPIKKLNILDENLIGNIKLEVIAEGNVFVPWQSKFQVKSSKNIRTLNEGLRPKIGVEVGKIR